MNTLYLASKKVARHFGAHPERGRSIKGLPTMIRTAGVQWKPTGVMTDDGRFIAKQLSRDKYDTDFEWANAARLDRVKIVVHPVVCLRCVAKDRWLVTCEPEFWPQIKTWLVKNCR